MNIRQDELNTKGNMHKNGEFAGDISTSLVSREKLKLLSEYIRLFAFPFYM